jgi:alkanesulfonate monooxygenase SsuD/methylene tetrahydromethanopterin reductase-like flavin-dependent oxidoreductase (luciferase family)
VRYAVSIPTMTEPSDLIDLGVAAEDAGWDGAFLWDHVYGSPAAPMPVADTWTVLAALAVSTRRITIGPMVTPLARRRPHKVAREGPHVTVRAAQFLPRPVNGNVPVWVAATLSRAAPARRAARHDGIVLTDPNAESGIGTVTPAAVREACKTVTRSRGDLHDFDVAVICPEVPSADDAAAYQQAGVTWTIVTGWLDQLRDAISAGPPA